MEDRDPGALPSAPVIGFSNVYLGIYAPYGSTRLVDSYRQLMAWLQARGPAPRDVVFIGMSLDDPSITPAENCRYDLGVAFLQDGGGILGEIVRSHGRRTAAAAAAPAHAECQAAGFSVRDFEPQEVVAFHCVGDITQVGFAWQYLYRVWLPSGRYEPADLPAMEMFVKLPEEIGWETFDLQTCIPVAPL